MENGANNSTWLIRIKSNNASKALCPVPSSQGVLNSHSLIIIIRVNNSDGNDESTNKWNNNLKH